MNMYAEEIFVFRCSMRSHWKLIHTPVPKYTWGVVAILFGSVHLIPAFFLAYPSHGEKWLWRISGVLITVQPLTLLAAGSIQTTPGSYFHYFIDYPFTLLSGSLTPLYIIARVALIILAFLSLRDLPYTALVAIDWISSIPHL